MVLIWLRRSKMLENIEEAFWYSTIIQVLLYDFLCSTMSEQWTRPESRYGGEGRKKINQKSVFFWLFEQSGWRLHQQQSWLAPERAGHAYADITIHAPLTNQKGQTVLSLVYAGGRLGMGMGMGGGTRLLQLRSSAEPRLTHTLSSGPHH